MSGYLPQRRRYRPPGCARRANVQSFRRQEPSFGKVLANLGSHAWVRVHLLITRTELINTGPGTKNQDSRKSFLVNLGTQAWACVNLTRAVLTNRDPTKQEPRFLQDEVQQPRFAPKTIPGILVLGSWGPCSLTRAQAWEPRFARQLSEILVLSWFLGIVLINMARVN